MRKDKVYYVSLLEQRVAVAQPDRVFGYEPKGRGFESLMVRQKDSYGFIPYESFLFFITILNPTMHTPNQNF